MLLYKQYDKTALDHQYNNRLRVPEHATYAANSERWSRETEKKYPVIRDITYGKLSRERLDIYPSALPGSKTLIYIHGGYWHKLDKADFHFIAGAFHAYNITTVLITYPLAPDVLMDQVVLSCRAALLWVHENISKHNGNPDELYIAGHSAGGHLAAMLMAADWNHFNTRLPTGMIRGVCALSGLFNLLPIQLSELNEVLNMDDETVMRNSPVELSPIIPCPLLITVGADESDEFKDQSEELYSCWKKENVPVTLMQLPGVNHYSIVEAFADINSMLHHRMLEIMGIV